MNIKKHAAIFAAVACVAGQAQAADWSDTFIGYRYGTQFREPNNNNDVTKNILQFTHASGYSIGQNFVNLDVFKSDSNDPASGDGSTGATEAYLTYRGQLYLGKIFDRDLSFGPVKDIALTAGFDLNTKNTKFAPAKRLLVIGPTLKFDVMGTIGVPGFLDFSLYYGREWNHCGLGKPACPTENIVFDPQWILAAAWGIPFQTGPVPFVFKGFINYLSEKGPDYAGVPTSAETLMRTALMIDVGQMASWKKNTVLVGLGYELWRNKFGNQYTKSGATKPGIDTDALMFQAEFHF
ncbi:MAG: hypothetical protein WAS49_10320 [Candidatus Dechloromonas phosphoritropha]|jgi:nucleoside-specific outer membrane channel protein Tsx|nr:hypothetical protein [Candidatus Dechloromonas phosphoritropha]MBP8789130.1 hypothetical protein [Azonexus sp.]MBP9228192.1 hypothetical protein [Azonexus sp.]